ncbi:MAG: hypothetical protein JWN84_4110 [Nocardioides sp.]|nr:hypothetical protein [Nocardioides sp.]
MDTESTQGEVLVVTPSFFGYEECVVAELASRGRRATLLDERPSNSSWVKASARVAPALIATRLRRHYRQALRDLEGRTLDLVLVIKAEVVPLEFLERLRRMNPRCVFVFYAFDSFANSPRGRQLLPHVDHAFSFDRDDVARVEGLRYKPLFHTQDFAPGPPLAERAIDLAFVGTLHSDRYGVCQALAPAGATHDYFFYSPARWHHELTRLRDQTIRRIPTSDVSFTKLTRSDVARCFSRARAVIDAQRTGQSGLTIRTFEVLAAGTKLITTNANVRDEPLYDPRWVLVLPEDRAAWDLDEVRRFVADDTAPPAERLAPYSLERWVDEFWDLVPSPPVDAGR